nr:MAG TPA: hypothetical protein [Bacteriophage sp.]
MLGSIPIKSRVRNTHDLLVMKLFYFVPKVSQVTFRRDKMQV